MECRLRHTGANSGRNNKPRRYITPDVTVSNCIRQESGDTMKAIINAKAVLPNEILPNATILVEDDRICAVGQALPIPEGTQIIDADGMWVGPGFVDIHVHGNGSTHRWETGPEQVARHHLLHGTTTMVASMGYSQSPESLLEKTKNVQQKIDAGLLPNVYAVGFEGPFINPERGANSSAFPRKGPDPAEYLPLYEVCRGKIAQWMYAPEMDTDGSFGDFLAQKKLTPAIGHTNASPAQIRAAVDKGARIATHLFDAMGCWMGNDSWRITGTTQDTAAVGCLICKELTYEIIPDSKGVHVKPSSMQLTYQLAGADRIAIITDCTICNYDPAEYPADHFRSTPDLNYNDKQQLAGSRLTMDVAFRNFGTHTGASVPELFRMASTTPARAIGVDHMVGSIEPGKYANLVLLDEELRLQRVIFHGAVVEG